MDFPSSKHFCSPAGQIQPQHAWLQTAAAHPQQLQPGGGRRPESIRGRVGDGQGGLACCDSWGHKESDTIEQLI